MSIRWNNHNARVSGECIWKPLLNAIEIMIRTTQLSYYHWWNETATATKKKYIENPNRKYDWMMRNGKKWAEFVMKLRREKERQLSWMSIGATQRCATKLLGALRKLIDKRISHPTDDWQFEFDRKLNWNAWKCMPISGFIFFPHSHNFYPFLSIWWLKGMKQDGKKYQSGM